MTHVSLVVGGGPQNRQKQDSISWCVSMRILEQECSQCGTVISRPRPRGIQTEMDIIKICRNCGAGVLFKVPSYPGNLPDS